MMGKEPRPKPGFMLVRDDFAIKLDPEGRLIVLDHRYGRIQCGNSSLEVILNIIERLVRQKRARWIGSCHST